MEKPNIISKIYGYAVCLVTVITFLICVSDLVNAIIDRGDPLHAGFYGSNQQALASYEIYKVETLKSFKSESDPAKATLVPDEKTMHAMYDAARQDKITAEMHRINKSMLVDTLLIVVCIILFITHWRWLRKSV